MTENSGSNAKRASDADRLGDDTGNLPLNGRNYIDLSLLQPGVASTYIASSTPVSAGSLYEGEAGQSFSPNGAPIQSNNYLLDGTIVTNGADFTGSSVIGTTLGVDGIQEYRVITNSFNAEYGQKMGSQMMIVSKGGTNQFHGEAATRRWRKREGFPGRQCRWDNGVFAHQDIHLLPRPGESVRDSPPNRRPLNCARNVSLAFSLRNPAQLAEQYVTMIVAIFEARLLLVPSNPLTGARSMRFTGRRG